MAAEIVKINIDVDADTSDIAKTSAALAGLGAQTDALGKKSDKFSSDFGKGFAKNKKIIGKFADFFDKTVSFIFKAFAAQTALAAVGLVAITAAFNVATVAAKAWKAHGIRDRHDERVNH